MTSKHPADDSSGRLKPDDDYVIRLEGGDELVARTVIIATGVAYRQLDAAGLDRFEGAGVFYTPLAGQDQILPGDPVAIVGGGNSAGDVRSNSIKRVASAVGEGSIAIRLASEHLSRPIGPAATGPPARPWPPKTLDLKHGSIRIDDEQAALNGSAFADL